MMARAAVRLQRLIVVAFMLIGTTFALGQTSEVLTNDDIIKMVRAQLATGIILTTIDSSNAKFDLSPSGLIQLKEAGVEDRIIEAMQVKSRASGSSTNAATRSAPEKSELLATSKDRDFILRQFKTILVDATKARYFDSAQMRAALGRNKDFAALNVSIVEDSAVADAVLEVDYTFAWDFPLSLRHQNTSVVLVSGKGTGPFSGPRGATSVANELVKLLKPYRVASPKPANRSK